MADSGSFDMCQCICSREAAIRRLLILLRQSQNYCTDTECSNGVDLPSTSGEAKNVTMIVIMLWLALAIVLYLLRPPSLRRSNVGDMKTESNNNHVRNQQSDR
ncbi:unnamed protein product [Soboliphyme baturini]|uniref:Small integral membrane protein 14 n=1 Tax=Soboliphyme baturini TaxID=241478 RepID=A0A183J3T1_9BILA|nr:unnamed protein product [Soboliphyme baturini]